MKYLIRRIPKKMIAQLQRGRTIENSTSENNICSIDDSQDTLPVLHKRGLIDIKMVVHDNKEVIWVYLTQSGVSFLNQYEENKNGYN